METIKRHENSEVGEASQVSQLGSDVVAVLLTISSSDGDVTVWTG